MTAPMQYAIRTAPFGNVLYIADSPDAAIAKARTEGSYFPEYDDVVSRPKPVAPDEWTVVIAATEPPAEGGG